MKEHHDPAPSSVAPAYGAATIVTALAAAVQLVLAGMKVVEGIGVLQGTSDNMAHLSGWIVVIAGSGGILIGLLLVVAVILARRRPHGALPITIVALVLTVLGSGVWILLTNSWGMHRPVLEVPGTVIGVALAVAAVVLLSREMRARGSASPRD